MVKSHFRRKLIEHKDSGGAIQSEEASQSHLFVCGIGFTSGQLITELFPDYLKVMLFALGFVPKGR